MEDKILNNLIKKEINRQQKTINLIASENFVSRQVLNALGSVFVDKYAEGYPSKRYYKGNKIIDKVEVLCQKRALKLFKLSPKKWHINVQPYSGSPANLAVYFALVPVGKKIMGMMLSMGGHLTHGQKVSITGKIWKQVPYGVNKKNEKLDYKEILRIAKKEKPILIVVGATAYSRKIDFKKFRRIADSVNAYLLVDMSHIAGLIAGGVHSSPFSARGGQALADVVMTTTHKTLRGPRAAIIFTRNSKLKTLRQRRIRLRRKNSKLSIAEAIDKAVFPGLQGGPHMNQIAAIAVCLKEAMNPRFKKYTKQIIKNAQILANEFKKRGWRIISNGTDNHLFLVDVWNRGITGKEASEKLEHAGIIVNKNMIPFDERKPFNPSGIRIGTPAITTRGMKEKEMRQIAEWIYRVLIKDESSKKIKKEVEKLCRKFPVLI